MNRTPGQKGPVRGTFEDDGEKATAILDSSGKKLVFWDAHLIGGVFARKYGGPSAPASRSNSFASAVLNETDSSHASMSPQPPIASPPTALPMLNADLILSSPTSGEPAAMDGQAIPLPESFTSADISFLNQYTTPDDISLDYDIAPDGNLRLSDIIAMGTDTDGDESNSETPMAASLLPSSMSAPSTPIVPLAHLNHMNVSAFKRKAEPHLLDTLPSPMRNSFVTPLKRKRRSTRYEAPYSNPLYEGVTPVQRVSCNDFPSSSSPVPSTSHTHKRRKTIL